MGNSQVRPSSQSQIVVKLLSQRGADGFDGLSARLPGGTLDQGDVRFTTDAHEPADVVVVQNYLKYDTVITARDGYVWKWDNEPIVRRPFASGLDRIYTHVPAQGDIRVQRAAPVLDWWLKKSYDELAGMPMPPKQEKISAIASTKALIPGHVSRVEFINLLSESGLEIDIFGEGREHTLSDKWDGLAPYRYSVAIENSSKEDYWTEKISDCFLAFTVPLYFGATNIDDYFPSDSYIWLPVDRPQDAIEAIRNINGEADWNRRLPAVIEARNRVLKDYSLGAQLLKLVRMEAPRIHQTQFVTRLVHGRRTRPGGWIRHVGVRKNVQAQMARLVSRAQRRLP